MNISQYKLIVTDLDGTLINYGSDLVSAEVCAVVAALQERGVLFTIATGRGWASTKQIVEKLQIKLPVILQTGALVRDPETEELLRKRPLSVDLMRELEQMKIPADVDYFYLDDQEQYVAKNLSSAAALELFQTPLIAGNFTAQTPNGVLKHLFVGTEMELIRLKEQLEKLLPRPNLVLWPPSELERTWFLEVFDPSASKGQAVAWLAESLGLSLSEVLAFGDGANDFDLLASVGCGVAMENAPPALIEQAKLVIPGPEAEGIARFLRGVFDGL